MATTFVIGTHARVKITWGTVDEELVTATCDQHRPSGQALPCAWTNNHDTTDDAIADAEAHADGVR